MLKNQRLEGVAYYLKEDKVGSKREIYGHKGEQVTVLAKTADPLWAVQGKRHSFHVHKDKLSPEPIKVEGIKGIEPDKPKKLTQAEKLQLEYLKNK